MKVFVSLTGLWKYLGRESLIWSLCLSSCLESLLERAGATERDERIDAPDGHIGMGGRISGCGDI